MSEQVFFESQSGGVVVTNSRFVVGNQTYTMQGVTSIRSHAEVEEVPKGKIGPIAIILGGVIAAGVGLTIPGILVIAVGAAWLRKRLRNKDKWTYYVFMNSASGETRALSSEDEEFIGEVVAALNEAIVSRG